MQGGYYGSDFTEQVNEMPIGHVNLITQPNENRSGTAVMKHYFPPFSPYKLLTMNKSLQPVKRFLSSMKFRYSHALPPPFELLIENMHWEDPLFLISINLYFSLASM